ncbi:MAG: indole-3-glycerol phosphate synthase TrpC, partial [Actinobacteria bacterium]|nr:indole-3-glycerol phosphate synthase TrpC [Actinomycetota bacterium]
GSLAMDLDPNKLALAYERGGASALSVLTEPDFFAGAISDLKHARSATALPVLRKDFIYDIYQIAESRAAAADAVLLIVAAIEDRARLTDLIKAASDFGMSALVEVHAEEELAVAMNAGAKIIGINQRNLKTFHVDNTLAAHLRPLVPRELLVVAESGVKTRDDIERLADAGVDAVLVGETLVRSEHPEDSVAELLGSHA